MQGGRGFSGRYGHIILGILFALWLGLLLPGTLQPACSEVTIAVTPTRIPLSLAPGDSQNLEVTLINQGTEEVDLKPRVMALEEGTGGEPILREDSTCSWLTPRIRSLHLEPAESEQIEVTASVPAGVGPGLHRFALTFELFEEDGAGIGLTGGLAVIVDLEILESKEGGTDAFLVVLGIILAVVVALLIGLLLAFAEHRIKVKEKKGPEGKEGGEGQ